MEKIIIKTSLAPDAVGTYSQGSFYNGTYYFSGQIGLTPNGEMLRGFQVELEQILKNIDGLLQSQSLNRTNILKTSIFLTDLGNFDQVNQAYLTFFDKISYPARSCVEVPALPKGALIEIEVIAAKG